MTTWYRSAAEVPIRHALEHAETTGADRALAVAGARALQPPGIPGLVVSCGTAITVERIAADGTWQGGAIAPGLALSARALHQQTAQLPLVSPSGNPAPAPWGRSTRPALDAGVFWSAVGSIRELLARQAAGLEPAPWLVFTGGDAAALAPWIDRDDARIVPDLVLEGLARVAFS
jgi:type III pantothenate kinase